MSRSRTHHQHTVAKTYLAGFADQRGRIVMYRRSGVKKPVSIRNAAVRSDFYTYVDDVGAANEAVEHWLAASVEGPAAGPLRSARAGVQPAAWSIPALTRFVAVSLMRTATLRSYVQQIDAHTRPMLVLSTIARENDYDLMEFSEQERRNLLSVATEAVAAVETDAVWQQRSLLRTMLRVADELISKLSTWHWRLDKTTTPCLLTADAPVATITPLPTVGWKGILPRNSSVYLPVSPTHLLVASPAPQFDSGIVSAQLAGRINLELCRNADDAVYTHPDMSWPSALTLSPQAPTLPTPEVSWSASDPDDSPTFPATYSPPTDPTIAQLLDDLGAVETVQ